MELISNQSGRYSHDVNFIEIEVPKTASMVSLVFILLHIPLALLMVQYAPLSTFHAYVTIAAAIIACLLGRLDIAAAAAAYITGAEVLWRMTDASIFWEFGKYATILTCIIGIFRTGLRNITLPFLYFLLLIPSAILTAEASSISAARNELSFNLSGPLTLFASVCFFSGLRLNKHQFGRILIALVGPITGIVTIAISFTLAASQIYFSDESNPVTSGGYGPNQVSAMLGMGALAMMLYLFAIKSSKLMKLGAGFVGVVLLIQSFLTFSRGGAYMAVAGLIAAGLMLVRPRQILAFSLGTILFVGVFTIWVLPWLNSFTGGTLSERYTNIRATGRLEIVKDDLRIFKEHPYIGVGPGMAKGYRYLFHRGAPAHTEFSRMLAEHGTLGLAAIIVLIALAIRNIRLASHGDGRAITVSFIVWSIAFMFINAMRLAAPSFLLGLTSSQIQEDEEEESTTEDIKIQEDSE